MKELEIYVHIPFCVKKCEYCNFISFCKNVNEQNEYVNALIKEIDSRVVEDTLVTSIFFGGGTPSILSVQNFIKIVDAIKKNYTLSETLEFTIECNPNSITKEKLIAYKNAGINRLSIGVQSTNDKLLKLIGRAHNYKDVISALNLANEIGFKNINVDLLLSLPKHRLKHIKKDIKRLRNFVTHFSVYSLILEENTPLYEKIKSGKLNLPSEHRCVKAYNLAKTLLSKFGFDRYEVSNFAKKGFECKHNLGYWNGVNYIGYGIASHSLIDDVRYETTEDFDEYINADFVVNPPYSSEKLSLDDMREEYIMLGLRKAEGIDLVEYKNKFGVDLLKQKEKRIEFLLDNQMIEINKDRLYATELGFMLLNQIIISLV